MDDELTLPECVQRAVDAFKDAYPQYSPKDEGLFTYAAFRTYWSMGERYFIPETIGYLIQAFMDVTSMDHLPKGKQGDGTSAGDSSNGLFLN